MEKFLAGLNEKQREAVLETEGPVLIVAGAGAGKTKTITHRIFHLIKTGIPADQILAITFTNKAAKEMKERVEKLCQEDENHSTGTIGQRPFIGTFHSLGVHIIKQNHSRIGISKFFTIFDRGDSKKLVKEALVNKNFDPKQYDPGKILNTISREKGKGVTANKYAEDINSDYFPKIVATVWLEYEKLLRREQALDFDDLLLVAAELLKNDISVREMYQKKWRYIHVDEYQDTNVVQYRIVKMLSETNRNLCVVGDADQNIYSWRGADISNILKFEKDFPDAKVVLLEENYRSSKTILSAANEIIKKNKVRIEKNLFTQKESGEKIGVFEGWNETQEAYFVANKTKSLLEEGVEPSEIAILYRANFQSRTLEEAFVSLGIPYSMIGVKFFERKEIKDVLSYLRAALNRDSWTDIARIINFPARGIGGATLEKFRAGQTEKITAGTRKKLDNFVNLLDRIAQKAKSAPPSETIKYLLKETGLEETLARGGEDDAERWENIMELVTLASRYDDNPPIEGIEIFLGDAALASNEESPEDKQSAVKLMTVHSAKGLEFDFVFITGLEQGLFPHKKMNEADISQHEAEEERRLFYVALTRARKKIYLTHSQIRTIFGEQEIHSPSEFLFDIPPDHVEREFMINDDRGSDSEYQERIIEI